MEETTARYLEILEKEYDLALMESGGAVEAQKGMTEQCTLNEELSMAMANAASSNARTIGLLAAAEKAEQKRAEAQEQREQRLMDPNSCKTKAKQELDVAILESGRAVEAQKGITEQCTLNKELSMAMNKRASSNATMVGLLAAAEEDAPKCARGIHRVQIVKVHDPHTNEPHYMVHRENKDGTASQEGNTDKVFPTKQEASNAMAAATGPPPVPAPTASGFPLGAPTTVPPSAPAPTAWGPPPAPAPTALGFGPPAPTTGASAFTPAAFNPTAYTAGGVSFASPAGAPSAWTVPAPTPNAHIGTPSTTTGAGFNIGSGGFSAKKQKRRVRQTPEDRKVAFKNPNTERVVKSPPGTGKRKAYSRNPMGSSKDVDENKRN